jgi:glycosyltransferase involved in cell wall biosynthesis
MRVAIIHFRLLLRGGLETRLFSYMEWFLARGDSVSVVVSKVDPSIEIPAGIQLVQIDLKKYPKPLRQLIFDRKVKQFLEREKFEFSLSLGRTSGQDAVLAPGNHIGYLKALGRKAYRPGDWWQIALDRRAYRHSQFILAASEMMRKEVIQYFQTPAQKVHVLFPPLNTQRFHAGLKEQQGSFRAKYGFNKDKVSLLFVSTGHFRKGLPLLQAMMEFLPKDRFEILVAGTPFETAPESGIRSLGFIAESEELFAAADFTIHPSFYEPYGQIVPESLACGTPVIIAEGVGAKEIVGENEGIVVQGYDPQVWAKTVEQASLQSFHIPTDFAKQRNLELSLHMQKMLAICGLK